MDKFYSIRIENKKGKEAMKECIGHCENDKYDLYVNYGRECMKWMLFS